MDRIEKRYLLIFISVFLLITSAISMSGYLFYRYESGEELDAARRQLKTISDLKVEQILQWRKERIGDGEVFRNNPYIRDEIDAFLSSRKSHSQMDLFAKWLESYIESYRYAEVVLVDSDGNQLLSTSRNSHSLGFSAQPWFSDTKDAKESFLTDFHHEDGKIALDLVVPYISSGKKYYFVFVIDPYVFLYPHIQSWPVETASGETVLAERSGDDVLFLNELRHRKGSPLQFRFPMEQGHPIVHALHGDEKVMEGLDYRGVPVMAATRLISETGWGLVSKIDMDELTAGTQKILAMITISSLLLIAASGAAVMFLWQRHKADIKLAESEKFRAIAAELEETRDRLLEAQSISHIGHWDWDIASGRLTWSDEIYRIFCLEPQEFGATYNAFLERIYQDDRQMVIDSVNAALKDDKTPYNMEHRIVCANARIKIVREMGKVFRDGSGVPVRMIGTVQDMTEMKRKDDALRQSEVFNRTLVDNIPQKMFLKDENSIYIFVNEGYAADFNRRPADFIGMDDFAFHPRDLAEKYRNDDREVISSGKVKSLEERYVVNGDEFIVNTVKAPIKDDSGNVIGLLGMFWDVTEQRRDKERLRSLSMLQKAILDNAGYSIIATNIDGTITTFNRAAELMLGYRADEVIGKATPEIIHDKGEVEERARQFSEELGMTISPGFDVFVARSWLNLPNEYEWTYIRKDGTRFPVILSVTALRKESGDVTGFLGVAVDITERKRYEDELRSEKETVQRYFDLSGTIFVVLDADQRVVSINMRGCDTLGFDRDEIIGKDWFENFLPAAGREEVRDIFREIMAGRIELTEYFENPVVTKDGRERLISWHNIAIRNEYGNITSILSSGEDVTDKRKANLEYKAMLRTAMDGFWVADAKGYLVEVNDAYSELIGYSRDELLRMRIPDLEAQERPEDTAAHIKKIIETGYDRFETRHRRKDGAIVDVEVSTNFMDIEGGKFFVFIRDITEKKLAERALLQAKEEAERANAAKSDFLANVSHEIRTPMNAVIGLGNILMDTDLTPKQKDYLVKMRSSAQSLLGVIDDILDISKIEAGKMALESIRFRLIDVLDHSVGLVAMKSQDKGLEILYHISNDVPEHLMGDPLRLGQVVTNLLSNAVKFTNRGEIIISIRKADDSESSLTLTFSVKDTGIGISEEQMGGLFQVFSQADTSTTRRYGGSGLGLSICKRLVGMMGGEIRAESRPGHGSEFIFTSLFGKAEVEERPDYCNITRLCGMRVLVVDDNETARTILSELLESMSFNVTSVSSGAEAIREISRSVDGAGRSIYRLVMVDWKMPEIDGFETVKRIRGIGLTEEPKIIMVTAFGWEEAKKRAEDARIEGFLTKPVHASALFNSIMELFGERSSTAVEKSDRAASDIGRIKGAKILLVEDHKLNQEVAMDILERGGMAVDVAGNGLEAVGLIERGIHYDCVLMDIQMPIMDGYEATRRIRKIKRYEELPVIAMTAHAMSEEKDKCMAVGMNDHISKPFEVMDLYSTLLKWIRPLTALPEGRGEEKEAETGLIPDEMPGIDLKAALNRMGGNRRLFRKILLEFRTDGSKMMDELGEALEKGDKSRARAIAHTLKGTAGNISATFAYDIVRSLETAIKEGKDRGEISEQLNRLRQEMALVMDGISVLESFEEGGRARGGVAGRGRVVAIIDKLLTLLKNNDMQSIDLFEELRDLLVEERHREATKAIAGDMERLDFRTAREKMTALSAVIESEK